MKPGSRWVRCLWKSIWVWGGLQRGTAFAGLAASSFDNDEFAMISRICDVLSPYRGRCATDGWFVVVLGQSRCYCSCWTERLRRPIKPIFDAQWLSNVAIRCCTDLILPFGVQS